MQRKVFRPLLGLFLLLQSTGVSAAGFSDVPASSPYAEAFAYLQERHIVKGFPDGTARPEAQLSRIEGLVSILRMREEYAPQVVWFTVNLPEISLFPDVNQMSWYAPYVEVGFLEGIAKGKGNGTFSPADVLTVEQALMMVQRAYGETETNVEFRSSDRMNNAPLEWYSNAVSWAIDRNLIAPQERLQLGKPITRGSFFSILHRLHTIETKNLYAYQDPVNNVATIAPSTHVNFPPHIPESTSLAPPSTSYGPAPLQHEYASQKEFAITIPSLNLMDIAVIHPDDPFSKEGILAPLKQGLGHLFAYPGSTGKTMIYGHSSSYPWDISQYTKIFRTINTLNTGDRVYITREGTLHVYEVTHKQVIDAQDSSPFQDDGSGTEELILYTCWPPDSIKQRYLVHAIPVETVALR